MIITHETSEVGNLIRVITGIESEVMIRLHGVMVIDITPILMQFDSNKPVYLSIGKVDSEVQTIGMAKAIDAKPPFMAPLCVIDNNVVTEKPKVESGVKEVKPDHRVRVEPGKCKLCGNTDTLIKIDHDMAICPGCFKINAGLNKINKVATNAVKRSAV